MAPASELTISAAVEQFRVSRKTIRRRLTDGALDGARQRQGDHGPEWVFPAKSLESLGYQRREPEAPAVDGTADESRRVGRTAIAVGVLLLLCIGAFVGYAVAGLSDDDDPPESADPVWAVLADVTAEGDEVGVVGSGVSTAVPPGRIPVPIDDVSALEDGPRYVVVGPDAPDDVVATLESGATPLLALGTSPRGASVFDRAGVDGAAASSTSPATSTTTVTPTVAESEPPVEADSGATPSFDDDGPALESSESITVTAGDSFWTIAEDVVASSGSQPTVDAVTTYWANLVDANRDHLVEPGNADLIVPGQVLILPSPS